MPKIALTGRSVGLIVGMTIAVLIATGAMLAITHSNSAVRQQRLVVANYEVMLRMRETVVALQAAELGQQGYLLTGAPAALEAYERGRLHVDAGFRQLKAALAADPQAAQLAQEFGDAAGKELQRLGEAIATYRLYGRMRRWPAFLRPRSASRWTR